MTTTTQTLMTGITTLFLDWRKQMSWGRVCSAIALIVAIVQECRGVTDSTRLVVWLSVATGAYGLSKLTEPKEVSSESKEGEP